MAREGPTCQRRAQGKIFGLLVSSVAKGLNCNVLGFNFDLLVWCLSQLDGIPLDLGLDGFLLVFVTKSENWILCLVISFSYGPWCKFDGKMRSLGCACAHEDTQVCTCSTLVWLFICSVAQGSEMHAPSLPLKFNERNLLPTVFQNPRVGNYSAVIRSAESFRVRRSDLLVAWLLLSRVRRTWKLCYSLRPRNSVKLGYFGSHPISARVLEFSILFPSGPSVPAVKADFRLCTKE